MTPQPRDRELFVSERPVRSGPLRSDFGRERVYARRRMMTVTVLLLVIGGSAYALWAHRSHNPADIPTIKAETNYKQKPADPGGIDIPHQDVEVYDQLEGKNTPQPSVEHLLPPPEAPKDVPHSAAVVQTSPPPVPDTPPTAPVAAMTPPAPPLVPLKPHADPILVQAAPKTIATTVAPAPASQPAPVAVIAAPESVATAAPTALNAPQTIDDVLKSTLTAPAPPAPVAAPSSIATGTAAIQLASVSDQSAAQSMMQNLQQKYAADLGGVTLHLARADLGSRGIFYRIQSQGISPDAANKICSALKQKNAGCILVRK